MRNLILFLSIVFIISSCNHSKVVVTENSKSDYEVLFVSEFGGTGSDEIQIITSKEEFYLLWEELMGQPAEEAPSFDTDNEMIIVKSFRSNRTGGSEYNIYDIVREKNNIKVYYQVDSPTEIAIEVITNPVFVIKSKKTENPFIEFILNTDEQ